MRLLATLFSNLRIALRAQNASARRPFSRTLA
jgi:hypothetical protein